MRKIQTYKQNPNKSGPICTEKSGSRPKSRNMDQIMGHWSRLVWGISRFVESIPAPLFQKVYNCGRCHQWLTTQGAPLTEEEISVLSLLWMLLFSPKLTIWLLCLFFEKFPTVVSVKVVLVMDSVTSPGLSPVFATEGIPLGVGNTWSEGPFSDGSAPSVTPWGWDKLPLSFCLIPSGIIESNCWFVAILDHHH